MTTPARWKRPIDQAKHIARERQQRDNMTNRFSMLETLLPLGPKVTTTMMMSLLNVFAQFCCGSRLETVAIAALDYDLVKFLCLWNKCRCRFLDRNKVCFMLRCKRRFCFLVQMSTRFVSWSKHATVLFLDRNKSNKSLESNYMRIKSGSDALTIVRVVYTVGMNAFSVIGPPSSTRQFSTLILDRGLLRGCWQTFVLWHCLVVFLLLLPTPLSWCHFTFLHSFSILSYEWFCSQPLIS